MANDDFAVVVGISRYPFISDLKGPENDARNFHDWLLAPQGGGVPKQNAKLILSSDFSPTEIPEDAEPTTERIDRTFGQLVRRGMNNNGCVGRRLYIYLAGHGFAPNVDEAALLMANAGLGFYGNHIPGRSYANWFLVAAYFTEVVLFM